MAGSKERLHIERSPVGNDYVLLPFGDNAVDHVPQIHGHRTGYGNIAHRGTTVGIVGMSAA